MAQDGLHFLFTMVLYCCQGDLPRFDIWRSYQSRCCQLECHVY
ncbi:hypothetical protein ACHAWC_011936 [Mediolabrus comicus]